MNSAPWTNNINNIYRGHPTLTSIAQLCSAANPARSRLSPRTKRRSSSFVSLNNLSNPKTLTLTLIPRRPLSSTSSSTLFPPPPNLTASASTLPKPLTLDLAMEVEIKLRLPSSAEHQRLSDALSPFHLRTHLQENIFFDTAASDLSGALAALRIRFYDADSKCVLSLKARAKLVDGVSRVEEDEEEIDPSVGRAIVADTAKMASLLEGSRILKRVKDEIGVNGEFVCLGGFRNVRAVHKWEEGLILELDETQYAFGTNYEIECETTEPERVKVLLEGFLKEKGVPYEYSGASKFAVFRAGKLLP